MTAQELLRAKRSEILQIAAKYGVTKIAIFGSVARGEANPESDVDFLVHMEESRSLLDIVKFWRDLERILGRRVDVVESEGLHWYIRDRVIKEAMPL